MATATRGSSAKIEEILGGDAAAKLGCRCRWSNRRFGDGPFEVPVGERSLGQHKRRDGRKIGVGAPVSGSSAG